jgi:heme/copper-type cytochrome/quinol oxidase subunit 1
VQTLPARLPSSSKRPCPRIAAERRRLSFRGAGGLINMSYQLNSSIHNTQWVTSHFHLISAGAIVIMYFVIAYDIWPHLTGARWTASA